ncbi:YdcF family protein [Crenobacter sp. SG2303]|uniref:YdcF family protein n=1 Tax=Crenobacter oryzisoli TaxID=3056844 RepID=A0ABT7XR95_9NEIS|nr:YdcF family protein [Crenobacter sp. SG2303]MDN0076270.1 YdcF family protein [Crenobacter sp. SG2303]
MIYLFTTPAVSLWLNGLLERYPPLPVAKLADVDAIVVLGGGKKVAPEYGDDEPVADTLIRLRYAAHLARVSGKPVLVSGGAPNGGTPEGRVMAESLHSDFGIRPRWIEEGADTTADNARLSAELLRRDGVRRIALVSQSWHLARAVPAFAAQGLAVTPAPTGYVRYEISGARLWVPQGRAMQECHSALRELIGIGYYALRHH